MTSIPHFPYGTTSPLYQSPLMGLGISPEAEALGRQQQAAISRWTMEMMRPALVGRSCEGCGAPLRYDGFRDCQYCGSPK